MTEELLIEFRRLHDRIDLLEKRSEWEREKTAAKVDSIYLGVNCLLIKLIYDIVMWISPPMWNLATTFLNV